MSVKKKLAKRRQVRCCSLCNRIGHNRSTCPENGVVKTKKVLAKVVTSEKKQPENQSKPGLQFYVHHVSTDSTPSQHVVNLKKHNIWNDVETISGINKNDNFYYYHQPKEKSKKELIKPIVPFHHESIVKEKSKKVVIENDHQITFKPKQQKILKLRKPKLDFSLPKLSIKERASNIKDNFINGIDNFFYYSRQWQKIYFPLKRTVVSLVLFSLIIFAPTHAQSYYQNLKITTSSVTDTSLAGFDALKESTNLMLSGDMDSAQTSLTKSLQNFELAVNEMNNSHKWLQTAIGYIPFLNKELESRQNLVDVGYDVSMGNSYLLKTFSFMQSSSSTLTENVDLATKYLNLSIPHYLSAQTKLNKTDKKILPQEYQGDFVKFKSVFNSFVNDLQNLAESSKAIQSIFGGQGKRRYLVIFQNQNEIRPTGGFIGSFAIMEVNNGKITDLKIPPGGSYDLQGQLEEYVEPPTPLLTIVDRWHFRDGNWFADFPTSAEKLMWFYRHSRQISTDGVIAINAEVLNRVLNISGPLKDEKRNVILTANGAIDTIQKIVEKGDEKIIHKPKQIISDMAPKFIEYFQNADPKDAMLLLANLQQALEKKEIQAYFVDQEPQKMVSKMQWDGKILPTSDSQDYLMVVNSNIGGQKSDAKIQQAIEHEATIQSDGSIIVTVTINRTHTGIEGEDFYGFPNINYLRIYTPKGSRLLKSGGFTYLDENNFKAPNKYSSVDKDLAMIEKEIGYDPLTGTKITEEMGKTAFANWVVTKPGQSSKIYFTYQLPFKAFDEQAKIKSNWYNVWDKDKTYSDYQLVLQKQSGVDSKFESKIIYPNNWQPAWYNGEEVILASNGLVIKNNELDKDKVWTLVMNNNN